MALRRSGVVTTPEPVPGRDGELIQSLAHPSMARPRRIVLFDWEAGVEPGIGDDLVGPFETLGAVTARMHGHARGWQRPPGFTRLTWDFETSLGDDRPHWGRWRDGMGLDAGEGGAVRADGRRRSGGGSERYGKGAERFGLIHCDLRLANLLIDGPTVKVIDFDDCGFGWYMYDAATPVSFYEHEPQVPELVDAWVRGYRSRGAAGAGGRGRDPDLRHAAPAAAGRLDRVAQRDRARPVDGGRLHRGDGGALRGVSAGGLVDGLVFFT